MFGGGGGGGPMPMPMPMPGPMPSLGPGGAGMVPGMPAPFPAAYGPGMVSGAAAAAVHGPGGGAAAGGAPILRGTGINGAGRWQAVQATRRKTAAGQHHRGEMKERMRYIMYEIDETNGHFIKLLEEPFQFLDVCCCPGGFSAYSLSAGAAPRKGIGLSLPPELGGHLPAIPLQSDIYLMHFVDVTTVAAGVRVSDMGVGTPGCPRDALRLDAGLAEPPSNRCQLVILDGSFLGGKDWIHKETTLPDADNPAFNVYSSNAAAHKALLVAQLIIMANNLAQGGTLVLRLNMYPDKFTIGVLGLLRHVFRGDVCSYKPRSCHVHVGSYYLICKGFEPQQAAVLQWVPRWHACLTALRAKGPLPAFVPFPGLMLDKPRDLQQVWVDPMYAYHVHLWRFLKLVEVAMEEKAMLDRRMPNRPRQGRFTNSCGRIFAGVLCSGFCNSAHSFEELHPFVQKAFREPRGFLFYPGAPALMGPQVPYDPLPEALLELRQQATIQAVRQAQAQAASQAEALAAASAAGGGANVISHVGSYGKAVQLGMAGEWVHGLMRDPRDIEEAGEDAMRLFMRDDNVVLHGGFDEDEPAGPAGPHPGPGAHAAGGGAAASAASGAPHFQGEGEGLGHAAKRARTEGAGAGAEAEAEARARARAREEDEEDARDAGGGAAVVQPELLQMSGYQPRLGLVAIEVQDDETLCAMLDYLGC